MKTGIYHCGRLALLIVLCTVAGSSSVTAAPILYSATLLGVNEVPPNASPGIGFADLAFDPDADTLTVDVTFSDLIGTTTAAHLHCCAPAGVNASVFIAFTGFPVGVTFGDYNQIFNLTAPQEATLLANLDAGLTYVNIHTNLFPGGEIRGQVGPAAPVSEPASMMLLGTGLTALALRRARKKARH